MDNQEILNFYSAGKSLNQTANEFNLSVYMIKKKIKEAGGEIRTRSEQNVLTNIERTLHVNHNFFDNLNPINAYYLGFFAADASISEKRNSIKIGLSTVDYFLLSKIKEDMEIEREIKNYTTPNGYFVSELVFSSLKIKNRLKDFDIVSNKTYKEISMKNIPNELKIHYIRGYFDGNGSFSWNKNTKQGMVKIVSHKENILKEIQEIMGGTIYFVNDRNIYSLEYSTLPSIDFLNKIYENADRFLLRKYDKFNDFVNYRI